MTELSAPAAARPRLCLAGPMLGIHPGWVESQGEILARHFETEGYVVRLTSRRIRRLPRLIDTVSCMVRWARGVEVAVVAVFSGLGFALADITTRVARARRLPVVLILRGGNLPDFSRRHPRWVSGLLNRASAVVAPTRYLQAALEPLGVPITVIPNMIPIEQYPWRHRADISPRLLWMRTFHPTYRPDLALQVLRLLLDDGVDATLTMAGQEKGSLAAVRRLATELGLDGKVSFAGFLDSAAKRREFARHDVFLNTNRVDNTPVSVVEAGAFGLPVVATEVGGIPYLLEDGVTGLLVPDGDASAMARAVTRLLSEPALVSQLSVAGRAQSEQASWPAIRQRWNVVLSGATGAAR